MVFLWFKRTLLIILFIDQNWFFDRRCGFYTVDKGVEGGGGRGGVPHPITCWTTARKRN